MSWVGKCTLPTGGHSFCEVGPNQFVSNCANSSVGGWLFSPRTCRRLRPQHPALPVHRSFRCNALVLWVCW